MFIIFEYLTYIDQHIIVEITGRRICYFGSLDPAANNLITDKGKQQ